MADGYAELATTVDTGDTEAKTCSKRDSFSASPVSSVVKSVER